ncbi:MAG: ABC transporter permease subunit [Oscillochloridaceae bacterium]|nr:ABC transporter permease subunit [Chloroflexaceae bacterium]MDW8389657.1 ABC transporter permease subunit [Oscillochloridaceae bacterium]
MRGSSLVPWVGLSGLLLVLLAWHAGALVSHPLVMPSPLATFTALGRLWASGAVATAVVHTLAHALGGFALALLLGVTLGLLAGVQPVVRALVHPVVGVVQGVPPIAWIVLALLWFGTGERTATFTVMAATLPLLIITTIGGVHHTDPLLIQMARSYNAPASLVLRDIYLPHLAAYLFPTIVVGLGQSWKIALMAELLSGARGIGEHLGVARVNLDTAAVFAWIVIVLSLMFLVEYLIVFPLQRWIEPWRHRGDRQPELSSRADVRIKPTG